MSPCPPEISLLFTDSPPSVSEAAPTHVGGMTPKILLICVVVGEASDIDLGVPLLDHWTNISTQKLLNEKSTLHRSYHLRVSYCTHHPKINAECGFTPWDQTQLLGLFDVNGVLRPLFSHYSWHHTGPSGITLWAPAAASSWSLLPFCTQCSLHSKPEEWQVRNTVSELALWYRMLSCHL